MPYFFFLPTSDHKYFYMGYSLSPWGLMIQLSPLRLPQYTSLLISRQNEWKEKNDGEFKGLFRLPPLRFGVPKPFCPFGAMTRECVWDIVRKERENLNESAFLLRSHRWTEWDREWWPHETHSLRERTSEVLALYASFPLFSAIISFRSRREMRKMTRKIAAFWIFLDDSAVFSGCINFIIRLPHQTRFHVSHILDSYLQIGPAKREDNFVLF